MPRRRNKPKAAGNAGGRWKNKRPGAKRPGTQARTAADGKPSQEQTTAASPEELIMELLREEERQSGTSKKGGAPAGKKQKDAEPKKQPPAKKSKHPEKKEPAEVQAGKSKHTEQQKPIQVAEEEDGPDYDVEQGPMDDPESYYAQHGVPLDLNDGAEEEAGTNEDYSDTANERAREYRKGGYHPVVLGDVYNGRYRVVHKLGWGYFSTVWLVWDYTLKKFRAMKVQKSAEHYRDAAFDEIKLLSQIMHADSEGDRCCARMTDSFEHKGPFGKHVVMVFDVLGENLLKLIERYDYRGIPIPIVKSIAKQVLIALEHIHSINILHTDIKPENILLASPKHKLHHIMKHYMPPPMHNRVALAERHVALMTKSQRKRFHQKRRKMKAKGVLVSPEKKPEEPEDPQIEDEEVPVRTPTAAAVAVSELVTTQEAAQDAAADELGPMSETDPEWEVERFHNVCLADFGNSCWTDHQFTDEVQTRQYRSPEVILGNGYGTEIDVWSCACTVFELLTGEFLFDPKDTSTYTRDEDHLALMMELLGEMPLHMSMGDGKYRREYFDDEGQLRHIRDLKFWGLRDVLHKKYHYTLKKSNEIAAFLLPMLALDPMERATAGEMLDSFESFFEIAEDDFSPLCYNPAQGGEDEGEYDDDSDDVADDEGGSSKEDYDSDGEESVSSYTTEESDGEREEEPAPRPSNTREPRRSREKKRDEEEEPELRKSVPGSAKESPQKKGGSERRPPLRSEKENEPQVSKPVIPKASAREAVPWGRRRPPAEHKDAPIVEPVEDGEPDSNVKS